MKIWKQLLRPDIWYKTARGWFCPTRADCRAYVTNTKRALANKVPISIPLEHHLSANPAQLPLSRDEQMAAMVGLNTGFVDDLRINPDGTADVLLDVDWVPDGNGRPIRDEAEIKARLTKSIKFVSPYIVSDLVDGFGNQYGKGIAHVALTAAPVDHGQQPFRLSRSAMLGHGLFLSIANSRRFAMGNTPEAAAAPETDTEMGEPTTVAELKEHLDRILAEAGDDLAAAKQALCEFCEEHLEDGEDGEDETDESTDHDESGAVPAAPEPQYTALSRRGGDNYDPYGRYLNPSHPRSRNSH
jgi:hypothetical protein